MMDFNNIIPRATLKIISSCRGLQHLWNLRLSGAAPAVTAPIQISLRYGPRL